MSMMLYVSVDRVIDRITRRHKHLTVNRVDIADFCYDVVKDYGTYEGFDNVVQSLVVTNHQALLPCNIYSVRSVGSCGSCNDLWYEQADRCLRLHSTFHGTSVHVDMQLFRVDEEGFPKIPESMEIPCYYYCMWQLLLDPAMAGRMPGVNMKYFQDMFDIETDKARSSLRYTTLDEMLRIGRMMRTMLPLR